MQSIVRLASVLTAIAVSTWAAQAATITATITADNHYAFYVGAADGSAVTLLGGNELGAGGAPGRYNWSLPESYAFTTGEPVIYLAAWSDDYVAQGLLAELTIDGRTLLSGDPAWSVFATGIDKDDGAAYPAPGEMSVQIALADATQAWGPVSVDRSNGVPPWGTIAGISGSAQWMWGPVAYRCDPFRPGYDHDEYLIFRTPVPEPSTLALMVVGGLMTLRAVRRRGGQGHAA